MFTALAIALSYLVGSIPTGLWLGLYFRNVDIRQHGSKNIGATNTLRVLGKPLGIAALIGDMAKGYLAVALIARLALLGPDPWPYAPLACGLAAILGHTLSIFLKFRGGKGVATSAGVFLGLAPIPTLIALGVFLAVLGATRMVSAGSITAALAMLIAIYAMPHPTVIRVIATLVAALIIIRHRTNIQRILAGTENRF